MTRRRTDCLVALVLCCLPALTGCVDQEKKKALADLQTTEAALAGANRDLAATRATLDTTQKERDSLQKEVQDLKGENETQRKRIDKLTADLQASQGLTEQLKKGVEQARMAAQASAAQTEQLKKQVASAGEAAAKENENLKARLAAREKDLADRMAQIQVLQQQIADLQKKVEAASKPPTPAKPAP